MSDDNYEEKEYCDDISAFIGNNDEKNAYIKESIIVFLPVISKKKFLKYFEKKVMTL